MYPPRSVGALGGRGDTFDFAQCRRRAAATVGRRLTQMPYNLSDAKARRFNLKIRFVPDGSENRPYLYFGGLSV
ncbi:MAG: hypothetical protein QOH39_3043 [Verrucomicrobiota bacterium]